MTFSQGQRPAHVRQISLTLFPQRDLPTVPSFGTNRNLEEGGFPQCIGHYRSASQGVEEHRKTEGGLGFLNYLLDRGMAAYYFS